MNIAASLEGGRSPLAEDPLPNDCDIDRTFGTDY